MMRQMALQLNKFQLNAVRAPHPEQNYMSKYRAFTEESREQILRSLTNNSSSKQAWSFSRQKRFNTRNPPCPFVSYGPNSSTFSNRRAGFGTSRRKVFTEVSDAPSPWVYTPTEVLRPSATSFGPGRTEVIANTYIDRDPLKNPGPGNYADHREARGGYSMRPKTANHRNYFIDDRQQASVPGPGYYDDETSKMVGKNIISKFKSAILGGSALMSRSNRFHSISAKTPSAFEYGEKQMSLMGKSRGAKIGRETRPAFTDKAAMSSFTPGPGNYKNPSEFGHYKKMTPYI